MNRIQKTVLLLISPLLSAPAFAGPVALSTSGEGSALIAPLWSVREGHDTLISLRNNGAATAAKVRVIEADGVEAVSFNVYLGQDDTWVAALTNAGSDEVPDDQLVTRDTTCILPNPARDEAGVARIALPHLAHGNGYIEIIEMGLSGSLGPPLIGPSSLWPPCQSLAERFESGVWSSDPSSELLRPGGRLSALVHVVNVDQGTLISPTVTALAGFTDVIQHSAPGSDGPNLSTAHTSETVSGLTESRICDADGCNVHAWNQPVEAVASVLIAARLEASYSAKSSHGAVTQFVYTRPLARFESETEGGFAIGGSVLFAERNREGEEPESGPCVPEPPPVISPGDRICGTRYFADDWVLAVEALQFGQGFDAEAGSSILGTSDPLIIESLPERFHSGVLQAVVSQNLGDGDRLLISADGEVFPGDAIIGFAVQQRTNGTLVRPDGQAVRANYRSEQDLIRARVAESSAFGEDE